MNILRWGFAGLVVLLATWFYAPLGALLWLVLAGSYLYWLGVLRESRRNLKRQEMMDAFEMSDKVMEHLKKTQSGKKTITGILIACLLLVPGGRKARAEVEPPQCNPLVIGVLVVAIGGYVVYKMVQFCRAHFPPPAPPPAPPVPPATNAPPSTNATAQVNSVVCRVYNAAQPLEVYPITSYGWMDTSRPTNPVPWMDYASIDVTSSTDLRYWNSWATIQVYFSSNSMVSVVYDTNGVAVSTNWTSGCVYATNSSLTNIAAFPKMMHDPVRFFR